MTQLAKRRPRFERTEVPGMVLTRRDLGMLRAVHRHRLLRSTHFVTLAGGSRQAVLRRLQLLFHHGYLDRPPLQLDWYVRGSEPMVYALGRRGAKALAPFGGVKRRIRWEAKNRKLSRAYLHHALAVADAVVAFEGACGGAGGVKFIAPEEVLARAPEQTQRRRQPFRWRVEVHAGDRSETLGVEPDRVFGLRFGDAGGSQREAFFFLEADRGTMPVARRGLTQTSFVRKLLAYEATWRQKLHALRLGIPNFRVLTVTTNRKRVENLVAACQRLSAGRGLFLFTDRESFGRGAVLTQQWTNGRGEVVRIAAEEQLASKS